MSDIIIKAVHLEKTFRHYKSNNQKLQNLLLGRNTGDCIRVLKDVSFEIRRGEKVGIIGRPGSGKSTIMRLLAGIIVPDEGSLEVEGEITTAFNNRLCMDSSMTGRDNYETLCTVLGWSKETMKEYEQSIFEFAGVADVIDEPMKTYKKGCPSRLGFGVFTALKPDILLYDEKLTFGGKRQSNKAVIRLKKIAAGKKSTFIMTVNNLATARRLCKRGLVLHRGKIVFDGTFEEAEQYYLENCKPKSRKTRERAEDDEARQFEENNDAVSTEQDDPYDAYDA